jgi:hypothetical protein
MAAAVPFIATGVNVLSTAINVMEPILQAQNQNVATRAQAQRAHQEAMLAQDEAAAKEIAQQQHYRQELGKKRVAQGVSNIEETGSALELFYNDKHNYQAAIAQTRYEGALQASRFKNQALLLEADVKNRNQMARFKAGSNILKGIPSLFKM